MCMGALCRVLTIARRTNSVKRMPAARGAVHLVADSACMRGARWLRYTRLSTSASARANRSMQLQGARQHVI